MERHESPSSQSRTSVKLNPQEEALQSLCKQVLKSRFFRGFYQERLYVEAVSGYRDIVSLHRGERDLEKILIDIKQKLGMFYQHRSDIWIGISHGAVSGLTPQKGGLGTCLWLELDDMAFGLYWFNVKTVRFREHEIILKLKMVRPVEAENVRQSVLFSPAEDRKSVSGAKVYAPPATFDNALDPQIGVQDFVNVIRDWGTSIKQTAYNFISNDVTKDNIKDFLQFLGLVVISLLSGTVVAIKFLGIFLLRFMFEFSRLTHIMTPIILKIIDVFNKIVGGFYILLAMIWKDAVVNRRQPRPNNTMQDIRAIEYNRPLYKSIEYNVRQANHRNQKSKFPEFERNNQ